MKKILLLLVINCICCALWAQVGAPKQYMVRAQINIPQFAPVRTFDLRARYVDNTNTEVSVILFSGLTTATNQVKDVTLYLDKFSDVLFDIVTGPNIYCSLDFNSTFQYTDLNGDRSDIFYPSSHGSVINSYNICAGNVQYPLPQITAQCYIAPLMLISNTDRTDPLNVTYCDGDSMLHFRKNYVSMDIGGIWQYSTDGQHFVNLLRVGANNVYVPDNSMQISVNIKALLGSSYSQYIGQPIYFRTVNPVEYGYYRYGTHGSLVYNYIRTDTSYIAGDGSNVLHYIFLPPAPSISSPAIQITPSCHSLNNGKITIPGSAITSGFDNIRWLLRPGTVTAPCDPLSPTSNCGDIKAQSNGAIPKSGGISVENIEPGSYTLWVMNPGEESGNCYQPISITITELPDVQITNPSNTNVSCYGGSDGQINVSASGSDAASGYYFTLEKQDGTVVAAEQRSTGSTMLWQNLPAGNYRAKVRDGACSILKSVNITLSQPPQVTGTITTTQPTCLSPGNGSISTTADAGPTNYKYNLYKDAVLTQQSGITTSHTYTFSNLSGGNYTVEILNADYSGCSGWNQTVVLNSVTPLSLALSERDSVSCYGGSDGRLKLTGSGGSGNYQYTLTKTGLSPVTNTTGEFTGLSAGDYQIQLKNTNVACTDEVTQTYSVYQRAPLQVQVQKTDITCNSAQDGKLQSTVSGGSGSYSYTWQQYKNNSWQGNSFWFTTDTRIEGLDAGNYRLIITDINASGCTSTSATVTITAPTPVQITNVAIQQAVCKADGARINVTATGGDANYIYAYSLDGGTTYTDFTATTPITTTGTYTIKTTDGKGCNAVSGSTYTITLPATALNLTPTLSNYNGFNISCNGLSNGQITANATGGNGGAYSGYQYKLNSGSYQSSNIFSGLAAGNYTVTVKDGRGCEVTKNVTLIQPAIAIQATKTNISCYGQSTGTITTNITGGVAPYTMTVNGSPVNQTISGLAPGSYTLHVTDANNCTKDTTIDILYTYAQITPQVTLNDIRCLGSRGNVVLTTTGGDGNYTYKVSANNWATQNNWLNTDSLQAGTYRFRVTDGQGCIVDVPGTVQITAPPASLSLSSVLSNYNGYNVSCYGGNNGTAQITATGGNGGSSGYTYALDNGAFDINSLIQNMNAGNHTLKVKDARGCVTTQDVTLTQSSVILSLALVSKQDVVCANSNAGVITVSGTGGVGTLQYSIDGSNWQTSATFNNLAAGNYTVRVKDVNSCEKSVNVTILSTNPPIVIDNITMNDIICYGDKGTIAVQKHGGTGTLTQEYSLNGGAYTTFTNTTQLNAGNYTLRVKDGAGCYSPVSQPISITTPATALGSTVSTSNYNGLQISCNGYTDGSITINVTGGNGGAYSGYQYSINNGAYGNASSYTNLAAGTYNIKIKDARGCVAQQNITLQQPAAPVSFGMYIDHLICGNVPTGKINIQAAGGTAPYQYRRDNEAWQSSNAFTSLYAGSYTMQVKDVNGCAAQQTAIVNTTYSPIAVTATITPARCYGQSNGAIQATVTGGSGSYTYKWNNQPSASPAIQNAAAGNYQLLVTDAAGCSNSYEYTIAQPDALAMQVQAPAICDGYTNGMITAGITGGTPPYKYALNNSAWQTDNRFSNLLPDTYTVKGEDANGCTLTGSATISKLNSKPELNFLVATRKNALDTLAIKEISIPKPDQVNWAFHSSAQLMGYEGDMPLIKFNQQGTYWAEMTGQWGGCTYTLKKDIIINPYDPLAGPGYNLPVHVIDTVILMPNPNDGNFQLKVKLNRKQQVAVRIYSVAGVLIETRQYVPTLLIDDRFALTGNLVSGTYILRVISENDSRDVKFVINR